MLSERLKALESSLREGDLPRARGAAEALLFEPLRLPHLQAAERAINELGHGLDSRAEPLRVAILGGYTTQPIRVCLPVVSLALSRQVVVYEADFNSYSSEVLNPASPFHGFRPDIVIFATGTVNLTDWPVPGQSEDEVAGLAARTLKGWRNLWSAARGPQGALVLQHTLELPPVGDVLGRLAQRTAWSRTRYVQSLNSQLWSEEGQNLRLVDTELLARRHGSAGFSDLRLYFHSKHGFNPNLIGDYALLLLGTLRAALGQVKKALVTDLDNTLWGGTIGDDSVEGIEFGPDTATGEAHLEYALWLKRLRERGVTLAVCSKNEPGVAAGGFKHPAMPLKTSDFAAFECSFGPKVEGIKRIAAQLNVGVDSLVFVDDDPVERAMVSAALPEVSVVDMSGDPALFTRRLERLALFDVLDLTPEDLGRASTEAVARLVSQASHQGSDLDSFLAGLEIRGRLRPPREAELPRIDQLFRKTNQFNLTQQTWDPAELKDHDLRVATIDDRFAHYGIVSAMRLHWSDENLVVDNWVMSCRVFSRTVEHYILNELVRMARALGLTTITGGFNTSPKNDYARRFLSSEGGLSGDRWLVNLETFVPLKTHVMTNEVEVH